MIDKLRSLWLWFIEPFQDKPEDLIDFQIGQAIEREENCRRRAQWSQKARADQ